MSIPLVRLPMRSVATVPCADPFGLRAGRGYVMLGTTNETRDSFRLYASENRHGPFKRVKDPAGKPLSIFAADNMPAWIHRDQPDRWAPEIHKIGKQFVCVYTARALDGELKVAMAVSNKLVGPYDDLGPIICSEHGVIDATIHRDRLSGQYVMAYKHDDNSVGKPTPIFTRTFTVKGKDFAWTGKPNQIAISGDGHGGLLEGPAFCDAGGTTWCILSSDYFGGADYKMWIGRIDDIVNGKIERLDKLMTTESPCLIGRWKGPGHCSLVPEGPNAFSMYFHAWRADGPDAPPFEKRFEPGGEKRMPICATLMFDKAGQPYILEDKLQARAEKQNGARPDGKSAAA